MSKNSDKAWAGVLTLRARATNYLVTAIISFIVGFVTLIVSIPATLNNLGYSESGTAAGWVMFGIVALSVASTCSIAWVFTVTMANHGEVVYFSSASNKERKEVKVQSTPTRSVDEVIEASYGSTKTDSTKVETVKCSDCGVTNESGKTYCKVCGGILS